MTDRYRKFDKKTASYFPPTGCYTLPKLIVNYIETSFHDADAVSKCNV